METVYRETPDHVVTWGGRGGRGGEGRGREGKGLLLSLLSPLATFENVIELEITPSFCKLEASPPYFEMGGV